MTPNCYQPHNKYHNAGTLQCRCKENRGDFTFQGDNKWTEHMVLQIIASNYVVLHATDSPLKELPLNDEDWDKAKKQYIVSAAHTHCKKYYLQYIIFHIGLCNLGDADMLLCTHNIIQIFVSKAGSHPKQLYIRP